MLFILYIEQFVFTGCATMLRKWYKMHIYNAGLDNTIHDGPRLHAETTVGVALESGHRHKFVKMCVGQNRSEAYLCREFIMFYIWNSESRGRIPSEEIITIK